MKETGLLHTLVLLIAAAMLSSACSKSENTAPRDNATSYYTCTMHPSVRAPKPGKCPICSMELVPVMKKDAGEGKPSPAQANGGGEMKGMAGMPGMNGGSSKPARTSEFVVPVARQQQIGVTYARVERKPMSHTIRSVGIVEPDLQKHWAFVARVDGYVQQLFVTSPGQLVDKDAPLLSIYSPDLLTTEREFVSLLRMRDQARSPAARKTPEQLIKAAKFRLQQWNITEDQISELEKTRQPNEYLTLRSPFRGVVQEVPAHQGVNVKAGDHLVDVVDLSVVWVWAEFYENELSMLRSGQKVIITAKSFPGEAFNGSVALINPFIDPVKRTTKVRIDIPNADFKLRPGMFVNAELAMNMGEALTLPASAVMPTGRHNYVFVDKGDGKLEPRLVELGVKYGDAYEIKSGLAEGDRVVASANFLIDAEAKVQGALNAFGETKDAAPHHD